MKLCHVSDLHGYYYLLEKAAELEFDAWVITGDFFPNKTRGDRIVEPRFQQKWFMDYKRNSILERLQGKPVISVDGNHDFISLHSCLIRCGVESYKITPEGIIFDGVKFAGFPNIPRIAGEWNHESGSEELRDLSFATFESDPDVLVTHAPPHGILDEVEGYGITHLTNCYTYREHKVKAHFFGHCHIDGGKMREEFGTKFYNGATAFRLVKI